MPLFLCLLLCALSCSDEESSLRPQNLGEPPSLPVPHLANDPRIPGSQAVVVDARRIVSAQRNMVSFVARTAFGDIGWMNRDDWDEEGEACWSKTTPSADGACSYITYACYRQDGSLELVDVLNGECPDFFETRTFDNWTHMRVVTDIAARAGSFVVYGRGEAIVDRSWTWQLENADPPVGAWLFYDGDPIQENLEARLVCDRLADGTEHADWLWVGDTKGKWESDVSSDGKSGRMTVHQWEHSESAFRRLHEITWEDDHGQWQTFDVAGVVIADRSW
ncbi:MAG: hypothetical protein ACE15D_18525 [Candidatus Eisenbacteria bacterium]|nr:hypothetical protein [Candidatus Eisenbacteria bacterium]